MYLVFRIVSIWSYEQITCISINIYCNISMPLSGQIYINAELKMTRRKGFASASVNSNANKKKEHFLKKETRFAETLIGAKIQ